MSNKTPRLNVLGKLPDGITLTILNDYLDKFIYFIKDDLKLNEYLFDDYVQINIKFSRNHEVGELGYLSIEEIRLLIRERYGVNSKASKLLNKINNYKEYFENEEDLLFKVIYGVPNIKLGGDIGISDIKNLFSSIKYSYKYLSNYRMHQREITLYFNNIKDYSFGNKVNEKLIFETVFIYNLFLDYFHTYKNRKREIIEREDYTSKIVKKSLATYTTYLYSLKFCNYVSNIIKEEMRTYPVFTFPNAGALGLIISKDSDSPLHDFNKIFDLSLKDMDGALRELLTDREFYQIKNKETIIKNLRLSKNEFYKLYFC